MDLKRGRAAACADSGRVLAGEETDMCVYVCVCVCAHARACWGKAGVRLECLRGIQQLDSKMGNNGEVSVWDHKSTQSYQVF